jgi:WD40 repeat protein
VQPRILDVWRWEGGVLLAQEKVAVGDDWCIVWRGQGRYLTVPYGTDSTSSDVLVRDTQSDGALQRWALPQGWWCQYVQSSRNGRYAGLYLAASGAETPGADAVRSYSDLATVGLFDAEARTVTWFPALVKQRSGGDVRSVLPSDDGAYVAFAAWDAEGGVTMIDVAGKRKLWSRRPGSNVIDYVGFSPDSKVLYGGGTEGAVYSMDVKTGDLLGRWYASESGKEEYGHRISCLATSADGRWVAAGTGPAGLVFVGSTASSKCVAILQHGGGTMNLVMFSPDSSALVTFGGNALKVWNVSQWDTSPPSTAPAPTQSAATTQAQTQRATTAPSGTGQP